MIHTVSWAEYRPTRRWPEAKITGAS